MTRCSAPAAAGWPDANGTPAGRGCVRGIGCGGSTQGRPDLDVFVATTDSRWHRQQPNQRCRVAGCGYGVARQGLCALHARHWLRAGRPELDSWLHNPPAVTQPEPGASCRIPHCTLWPQAAGPFCRSHANTWKVNGRPDIDEFARRFTDIPAPTDEHIRFDLLGSRLKLEMQYVLQRRQDERRGKLAPHVAMRVIRLLAQEPVTSLLDNDDDTWRVLGRTALNDSLSRSFLGYAYRQVADLAEAGGWEAEYPRDVWHMRRLGFDGDRTLRFTGIPQPWLRELAKRWVRWRLSTGLGLEAGGGRPVVAITRFARFLADIGDRADRPDRPAGAGTLPGRPEWRLRRRAATRHPHRAAQPLLRRDPPTPLGHSPSRPMRCSSPRTIRNARNGCRGRWPSTSWPSSSIRATSPGSPTPPTG